MYQETVFKLTYVVARQTYQGWRIPQKEALRTLSDHEFVFVSKGVGEVYIDGKVYALHENMLVYFPPNVVHRIYAPSTPAMHFYGVHFSFDGNTTPLQLPYLMDLASLPQIGLLFKAIERAHRKKDLLYQWRSTVLFQECLLALFEHQMIGDGAHYSDKIKRVLAYIHKRPYHHFTVAELCNYSGLQKTAFNQKFRAMTGTTPLQYCQALKLEYAKDLLLSQPDLSVLQVAQLCGFEDALYFSRCFKLHTGVSPRTFRAQNE